MKDLSVFQLVVIAAFGIAALIGVVIFATGLGLGGGDSIHDVTIWGTEDKKIINALLAQLKEDDQAFSEVVYVEKDPRSYIETFVNALAAGTGPDLLLIGQTDILAQQDKIITIPYGSFSERQFKDTFIEEGELFLNNEGVIGLPFKIDPMVMYWNRDIFQSKGVATPPQFWDELFVLAPRITERDRASNIVSSFVALGEFRNVLHAKDILSTLIFQTGNPIVRRTEQGLVSLLAENFGSAEVPAQAALRFFTEFSNPVKSVYSWNRALPDSRQSFLAGDLALYIGFASELSELRELNPNLNFDVAPLPQSRDASTKVTFGHIDAFVISRVATDPSSAFAVAVALTQNTIIAELSLSTGLPPVRRDLLRSAPSDAYAEIFYNAALSAQGWLDPNSEETDAIFKRMIESSISGRARLFEAVGTADEELSNLLKGN